MKTNKVLLVITDGIGYNEHCENNAFCRAKKRAYEYLLEEVPHALINTSGLSVGLPEGQMGNSEVGHMTIGSGRVLYQNLVKISKAVEDGSIAQNKALNQVLDNSGTIHIVGLMSDGGVHSHIDHIKALAKVAAEKGHRIALHLITDGRDVSPTSAPEYLDDIETILNDKIFIASISGRFYTMDRDNRWERVEKGYRAIVQAHPKTDLSPKAYIEAQYGQEITDEFIDPVAFGDYAGMENGDGVIFSNFRSDRMREITDAIGNPNFIHFERKPVKVHVATMTEYSKDFNYPVLFKEELPDNVLAKVISDAGLNQLHTSETEKYAHVTFFLNGGVEEPFINETRVLVPSPQVKTYDLKPEMSAAEVGENVRKAMKEGYDFIVVNFANGDMVGHTGNLEAAIKAVETVDDELDMIIKVAKDEGYSMVLTSDHGNCEEMVDSKGHILTNHTLYDVFCFVMSDDVKEVKSGGLNNVAPTVLKLMNLPIPEEMDAPLI
ncbi:MAG TPA: 2,3-bisphosphoglycerate-independent phosphoglycerate mutase [Campylobacteraceae bacterium]|nr:2,3-bisphosphoglycerate-independent phosphoglycerate mutase [Campylobacteraceae bacterium]